MPLDIIFKGGSFYFSAITYNVGCSRCLLTAGVNVSAHIDYQFGQVALAKNKLTLIKTLMQFGCVLSCIIGVLGFYCSMFHLARKKKKTMAG